MFICPRFMYWSDTTILHRAVHLLKMGEIVCLPTETVYALACSAHDRDAIARLYKLKKRPLHKPISVLFSKPEQIYKFSHLRDRDFKVIKCLSPGPVTFVTPLDNRQGLPEEFFNDTIGARIPKHNTVLAILDMLGYPVAATSANLSGECSAVRAAQISVPITQHITLLIEEDSTVSGIDSTVIDLMSRTILRQGIIPDHKIYEILSAH